MGIYSEYGIEYSIKLKTGTIIPVVPIKQADQRLLASKYYQSRKEYYANNYSQWREKAINCDCELSLEEKNKLTELLNMYDKNVLEHGWYDVRHISSTY